MSNDNDIRRGRHCVFLMHVHLVFVTKYRREVFTKEILDDLRNIGSMSFRVESNTVTGASPARTGWPAGA